MRKRRIQQVLCVLLICMITLFGCSRTRIIDKISIVHVFGFDQAENGDLIGTALIPDYTMSKDGNQIQSLEEEAPTGVLFGPKMSAHTSTPIELAKIRVMLLGKSFAEAGVQDMIERFITNPQIGTHIQIAATTHSAKETLDTFKQEKSLTLAERLEHNMLGQHLPNMNLHIFLNHFYGEGMDAFLPMITIDEKNRVKINGIGIFNEDKLKLHLNSDQTTLFSYLEDERTQATYKINLDENNREEMITVRAFQSKSNWKWNQQKEQLNLHLQLKMTLTQYPNRFNVEKTEDVSEMKKIIVKKLEKDIGDLFTILQENEVDPLGIGNMVRSQDKTWEEESFYEQYATLPINVDVNLQIIHSGLEG